MPGSYSIDSADQGSFTITSPASGYVRTYDFRVSPNGNTIYTIAQIRSRLVTANHLCSSFCTTIACWVRGLICEMKNRRNAFVSLICVLSLLLSSLCFRAAARQQQGAGACASCVFGGIINRSHLARQSGEFGLTFGSAAIHRWSTAPESRAATVNRPSGSTRSRHSAAVTVICQDG